ncbi:hypothetical protein BGZ68_008100 [Mortierella alpina]|nr:hypothetical protein BGZ68_008100 [Mortierella alpina]
MSDSDDSSISDYQDEILDPALMFIDSEDDDDDDFHVIISGAGIGGLMLANLLEAAGSVVCLMPNVLPVFEQLGLYDEIKKMSYPVSKMDILSESNLKKISDYNFKDDKEWFGYQRIILQRPVLHSLLLQNIPPKRIHFGKKFKMLDQRQEGVAIQCTDKSEFYGDILVGADGVNSGVRQSLYWQMAQDNILPSSDLRAMSKGYVFLAGVTRSLSPADHPGLDTPSSNATFIISDGSPHSCSIATLPDNKIGWHASIQLSNAEFEEGRFRNSDEWEYEANDKTLQKVADCSTPFGKLGKLFQATPREMISRAYLGDILHETWHYQRTVLIGDACHKLLPNTGEGANAAIQDAIALANGLYELTDSPSNEEITESLQEYRNERYPIVKAVYNSSQLHAKLQMGHSSVAGSPQLTLPY